MQQNTFEIYQTANGTTDVQVLMSEDTVWLNRKQIADLFQRDVKTIGKHINNIFQEGELSTQAVIANFATTASDGKVYQVEHYNLMFIPMRVTHETRTWG